MQGGGRTIVDSGLDYHRNRLKLLGGTAVNAISWGSTAVPPSSWDKGCPDKHHIENVKECIVS